MQSSFVIKNIAQPDQTYTWALIQIGGTLLEIWGKFHMIPRYVCINKVNENETLWISFWVQSATNDSSSIELTA